MGQDVNEINDQCRETHARVRGDTFFVGIATSSVKNFEVLDSRYVDFIGWFTLIIFKIFNVTPKFNRKLIIFYDRFFFKFLKYLDIIFQYIIGKNILIVARKS